MVTKFDKTGQHEIPDPTPVEMPLGYQVPESLESMIARMCRDQQMQMELSRINGGMDTEEEADDFEIEEADDLDFGPTGHQMTEMQEEYVDLKRLRKDSEDHAAREVAERVERDRQKAEKKRKVKRSRKVEQDPDEDVPDEEGTVTT